MTTAYFRYSHGDNLVNGAGRSTVWNTRTAQIICSHVVPLFGGHSLRDLGGFSIYMLGH